MRCLQEVVGADVDRSPIAIAEKHLAQVAQTGGTVDVSKCIVNAMAVGVTGERIAELLRSRHDDPEEAVERIHRQKTKVRRAVKSASTCDWDVAADLRRMHGHVRAKLAEVVLGGSAADVSKVLDDALNAGIEPETIGTVMREACEVRLAKAIASGNATEMSGAIRCAESTGVAAEDVQAARSRLHEILANELGDATISFDGNTEAISKWSALARLSGLSLEWIESVKKQACNVQIQKALQVDHPIEIAHAVTCAQQVGIQQEAMPEACARLRELREKDLARAVASGTVDDVAKRLAHAQAAGISDERIAEVQNEMCIARLYRSTHNYDNPVEIANAVACAEQAGISDDLIPVILQRAQEMRHPKFLNAAKNGTVADVERCVQEAEAVQMSRERITSVLQEGITIRLSRAMRHSNADEIATAITLWEHAGLDTQLLSEPRARVQKLRESEFAVAIRNGRAADLEKCSAQAQAAGMSAKRIAAIRRKMCEARLYDALRSMDPDVVAQAAACAACSPGVNKEAMKAVDTHLQKLRCQIASQAERLHFSSLPHLPKIAPDAKTLLKVQGQQRRTPLAAQRSRSLSTLRKHDQV